MELFTSLQGRIGRGKFWLGFLGLFIANIVVSIILAMLGFGSDIDPATGALSSGAWIGLLITLVIFVWPSICIYGKRFHDRNKSAWWMMIMFVPIIGFFWLLIECGFLKGTEGPNDYGPDPLA